MIADGVSAPAGFLLVPRTFCERLGVPVVLMVISKLSMLKGKKGKGDRQREA
jgi:hypothetical protein